MVEISMLPLPKADMMPTEKSGCKKEGLPPEGFTELLAGLIAVAAPSAERALPEVTEQMPSPPGVPAALTEPVLPGREDVWVALSAAVAPDSEPLPAGAALAPGNSHSLPAEHNTHQLSPAAPGVWGPLPVLDGQAAVLTASDGTAAAAAGQEQLDGKEAQRVAPSGKNDVKVNAGQGREAFPGAADAEKARAGFEKTDFPLHSEPRSKVEKSGDSHGQMEEMRGKGLETQPVRAAMQTPASQFGRLQTARAAVLEQVLEKMVFTKRADGEQALFLRLKPAVLGEVEIRLQMDDGRLTARIVTENTQVKEVLDVALWQLRQRLEAQQIHVAEISVTVGQEQGFRQGGGFADPHGQRGFPGGQGMESDGVYEESPVPAGTIWGLLDTRA